VVADISGPPTQPAPEPQPHASDGRERRRVRALKRLPKRRRAAKRAPTRWIDILDTHVRPRLPAGVVSLLRKGRCREIFNWIAHNASNLIWAAFVLAVLVILGLRLPDATGSFGLAFHTLTAARAAWLALALAAVALSFVCYGLAQRRLLTAGGTRLSVRIVTILVFASTGLTGLLPGGVVPASGWLLDQYRRRGIDESLGLWAIIAGGFVSAVSSLSLLLISCGLAGIGPRALLVVCGLVVGVGGAGFVKGAHQLERVECALERRGRNGAMLKFVHRLAVRGADLACWRIGVPGGIEVFVYSLANWLCDAACLVAVFELVGFPAPVAALFFAFTASQVLGSVVPLPGGAGVVEGGIIGALALTGTPLGHAIVAVVFYRIISYWLVTGLASLTLVVTSHAGRNLGRIMPVVAAQPPASHSVGS
jgi:putative heme transporter